MTTIEHAGGLTGSAAGLLGRDRIIAKAGFNRWLVPPAALCIHLCIGMAVPRAQLYDSTMYILCGMLIIGLICNYLIKPVDPKWYMSQEEVAKLQAASARSTAATPSGSFGIGKGGLDLQAALFWAFVGVPLAWGVWITLKNALKIF
jgi:hypothetical protein